LIVSFDTQAELAADLIDDTEKLTKIIRDLRPGGGTALYDAIYLAVQKAQAGIKPKKALVLITDGEDKDSYYSLDEMVAKVQESDVQIYSIGFLNEIPDKGLFGRWSKSEPEKARDALQRISEETGAKAFFPKNIAEIHPIIAEIAHELRSQYSISYISSNAARDGTWRRIRVALSAPNAGAMHVRYRSGYFAKPDAERNK
jgi:Ca-activated chloride channel family protein